MLAEHLDLVADPELREVGHVDHAHIHADAPDLLRLAVGREHAQLAGEGAEKAVGVADGQHRDAAGSCREKLPAVADGGVGGKVLDGGNGGLDRHDGLHAHPLGKVARAVENDAAAHHVPRPLGVAGDAAGVAAVVQAESKIALRFHGVDHAQEAVVLDLRKFHALVCRLVTDAEVREHALHVQPRKREDLQNVAQARVEVRVVALEAEAAHAGVELDVDLHRSARADRGGGISLGDGEVRHGLRHVVFQDALGLISGREAQHQDGERDPVHAQLLALVEVRHGEIARAEPFKMLRHAHRAVTVGIRLDHAEELRLRPDLTANGLKIMGEVIQADLRPCALQCTLHISSLLSFQV